MSKWLGFSSGNYQQLPLKYVCALNQTLLLRCHDNICNFSSSGELLDEVTSSFVTMFPPHAIKDGYAPYPSFCCWCTNRNIFFSSDLFPAPFKQWHRESRPLLSAAVRYNRMLHRIFCAPVIRWGLEGAPRYVCSLASKRSVKTLGPQRLKKLLFHRALEGTWEQFFILAAKQWNLCFQLHLSLLLFQQTIKAKLKEDWGKNCHKTVLHWPRGSRESHRSFPPLFSAVLIEEESWLLFKETPFCFLTPFTGLSWSGGGRRDLSRVQPGWALPDKGGEPHGKMLV